MDSRFFAKFFGVFSVFVIALLFIGAYFDFGLGYEYFRFMRAVLFVVLGGCAIVARKAKWWINAVFVFWILIYNPFYRPFALPRHAWEVVNVLTVGWLLWWLLKYVFSAKDEKAQAELEKLDLVSKVKELQDRCIDWEKYSNSLLGQISAYKTQVDASSRALWNEIGKNGAIKGKLTDLQNLVQDLQTKTDAFEKHAARSQQEMQNWRENLGSFGLGFMYEIYIAQTFENFGWDVQLVGDKEPFFDLECTNTTTNQKKYVECKYWAKGRTLSVDDLQKLLDFARAKKKGEVALYTSIAPNSFAEQALAQAGVEVKSNVVMRGGKFVKCCNGYYYIPTDSAYRTVSLKKGKIEYFESTFEAALAGYKRA